VNSFDEAFDLEPYPRILLSRGWTSLGRMKYRLRECEVHFDTSSQFEVFVGGKRVASHYARSEDEFVAVLEELGHRY